MADPLERAKAAHQKAMERLSYVRSQTNDAKKIGEAQAAFTAAQNAYGQLLTQSHADNQADKLHPVKRR